MTKQETYAFLDNEKIWYEITEHNAVFTMGELCSVKLPYPDCDAKNLFVRDDKKQNYYLITVKGDKRVDLKKFRTEQNARPLTFASEKDLYDILGLTPGSVTPLGVLNDKDLRPGVYLDSDFFESPGLIGCHPNDNTATVWMKIEDLTAIIEKHGNKVCSVDI